MGEEFSAEIIEKDIDSINEWFFPIGGKPPLIMHSLPFGIMLINGVRLYDEKNFVKLKKTYEDKSKIIILDKKTKEYIQNDQELSKLKLNKNFSFLHSNNNQWKCYPKEISTYINLHHKLLFK